MRLLKLHLPQRGEVEVLRSKTSGGGMSTGRARALRSRLTDAERILWARLRQLKIYGVHFRRQAPFENYVVDFACHRAGVIVEIDGGQHGTPEAIVYDRKRTAFLESRGYRVMRVWNNEVFEDPDAVADAVLDFARLPPPDPSPLRYAGSLRAAKGPPDLFLIALQPRVGGGEDGI